MGQVVHHFQTREKIAYRFSKSHSLVFSADGKRLFTSDDERGHVWDLTTGKSVSSFPHPADDKEQGVWIVAFSADGKLLATGTQRLKAVRVWDVATGKKVATTPLRSGVTGRTQRSIPRSVRNELNDHGREFMSGTCEVVKSCERDAESSRSP